MFLLIKICHILFVRLWVFFSCLNLCLLYIYLYWLFSVPKGFGNHSDTTSYKENSNSQIINGHGVKERNKRPLLQQIKSSDKVFRLLKYVNIQCKKVRLKIK